VVLNVKVVSDDLKHTKIIMCYIHCIC